MKNILIICGTFPPQSLVGGLRPAMFAKYLPDFGWNPWVIARDFTSDDPRYDEKMPLSLPQNTIRQVIKIKYSIKDEQDYLRSRSAFNKVRDFFYPEYSSPPGLFFAAKKCAEKLVSEQKFDLILSTVPDQWQLTLGEYLSGKYKIPLVADFRDIVEQEAGLKRSIRQSIQVLRFTVRRKLTTNKASLITTVSKYHQATLYKKFRRQTSLIYNGFDHEEFKPLINIVVKPTPFKIIYVGRILNIWYRNPKILFESIDQLIFEKRIAKNDITVEFYGTDLEKLTGLLIGLKCKDFIKFYSRVSYSDIPKLLNEAQILLLLTNRDRRGILTTKFFEYAGIKKPILCIPGDNGELDELINQYNLGYSIKDIKTLKENLVDWIQSFNSGNFPQYNSNDVNFFTRRNQTKILASVLDKVLEPL